MRVCASGVLVSAMAACSNSTGPPETAIEVAPVRFYYEASTAAPCAGTVPFLSQTAKRQAAFLGLPTPVRIDYHYRIGDISMYCPLEGSACAAFVNGIPTIWSNNPAIPHELVHAIVFPTKPVRFFAESLAVALGGDDSNADDPPYLYTPDQLLNGDGQGISAIAFYAIAGDFGSYLIDNFGPSKFTTLNPRVMRGTSTADVKSAFATVYGEPMTTAMSDRQSSSKRYASSRIGFPECNIDPTAWAGSSWLASGTLDCSVNGINEDGPNLMTTYATVDVPSAGLYQIALQGGDSSQRFSWQRCTSGEQFDYFPTSTPAFTHDVITGHAPLIAAWLPATRHFVRYVAAAGSSVSYSVSLQQTTSASTSCSGLNPATIGSGTDGVFAISPWDGPPLVLPFVVSANRTGTAFVWQASLALCDGTCDTSGSGCRGLMLGDTLTLTPGHNYAIVTQGTGLHAFAGLAIPAP